MRTECVVDQISSKEWDEFVKAHPKGNIFQTKSLFDVYLNTDNYCPIAISSTNSKTGDINGVLSGVVISEIGGFAKHFSSHAVVQGGPLIADEHDTNVANSLVGEYDKKAKKKAIYSEIRNMHDCGYLINYLESYNFTDHLDFHISLEQPRDALWSGISKSRRKNIKKAEDMGIDIVEINSVHQIESFCEIIDETYREVRIPSAPHSLFHNAFSQLVPKGYARFLLAMDSNECIGARAVLTYGNMIYDWYAGASIKSLSSYPNDFLVWNILNWGLDNGYSVFDFGGAGNPNEPYGPREFKRRFGGKMVNYGRFSQIYSPANMWIAKNGLKLYHALANRPRK